MALIRGKAYEKEAKIRTNSDHVYEALNLPCQCGPGAHVPMEGKSRALKAMQNYEPGFTALAAPATYETMINNWKKRAGVRRTQ